MNLFLFFLHLPYHVSVFGIVGVLVPPVVMGLLTVFSFALVKARLLGLDYYGLDNGERVAVLFQYLDRKVVLVEVLVNF